MKTKFKSSICAACHSFGMVCFVAVTLLLGVLASAVQASQYLFTGSETIVTLNPGTYDITAYGAQGGGGSAPAFGFNNGGLGAEMAGQFSFTATTALTLLVGGSGITQNGNGGGGGGGASFVVIGSNPLVIAGGGGAGAVPVVLA